MKLPAPGPPTSLQGKVDLGDTKFRMTTVSLTDRSTGEQTGVRVNPDGTFQFSDLPAKGGTFQIAIFNVPGAILSNVVASGAKVNGRTIEFGPGRGENHAFFVGEVLASLTAPRCETESPPRVR